MEKEKLLLSDVDLKKATEYAGEDADVTFRLYKLFKRLDKEKLTKFMKFLKNRWLK